MFNSIISGNNFKQVMNRFIFLAVLLPSVNVLAAGTVAPVSGAMQGSCVNEQATSLQAVDPYKAVKWKKSTYKESSNSMPPSARRVFKDDFQRVMRRVGQPHQTKMIWLSQKKSS